MDNPTEYCSFVSVDYIICECGTTFPNEDELMDHLESDHVSTKQENKPTSLYDNFIEKKNIKNEYKQPLVITEKLPEADIHNSTVYLEPNDITNEYYLENAFECETVEIYEPDQIKQEITVEYVDDDGDEQNYEEIENNEVVIEAQPAVLNPLGSKQVTFKRSQLADQMVILAQENEEHDYDRESKPSCEDEFYFCEVCGKCFTSEKTVQTHIRKVHRVGETEQKSNKVSVCDVCGKQYEMWQRVCSGCGAKRPASKSNQRLRERQKQNPGRFTCDVCGVGRSSNAALRYHQRIHTGEKPFKCTMCPKAFTMPLFLQLHTRTHTGERPYQCPVCPKAFSNQAALVRHNRVHTGVKPYPCPECGKAFTQSNSMKLHYQTVHLKMPAPYKSAARKLRDAQKFGQRLRANKIIIQSGSSSPVHILSTNAEETDADIPVPRPTLLFRHRRRREEPQYEYVMEPVHVINSEEYEEMYVPVIINK